MCWMRMNNVRLVPRKMIFSPLHESAALPRFATAAFPKRMSPQIERFSFPIAGSCFFATWRKTFLLSSSLLLLLLVYSFQVFLLSPFPSLSRLNFCSITRRFLNPPFPFRRPLSFSALIRPSLKSEFYVAKHTHTHTHSSIIFNSFLALVGQKFSTQPSLVAFYLLTKLLASWSKRHEIEVSPPFESLLPIWSSDQKCINLSCLFHDSLRLSTNWQRGESEEAL